MTRALLRVLLAVFVLLAALVAVGLASDAVARWLVRWIDDTVPALTWSYQDGDLWSGIAVTDTRYAAEGIEVSLASAELRWSLPCLASGNFCIERIAADGVTVTVTPVPGAQEDGGGAAGMPSLPVDILFRDVSVRALAVNTPAASVTVAAIGLRGSFGNQGLRLAQASVVEPVVRIAGRGEHSPPAPETSRSPVVLPAVAAPVPVQVDALRVERPAVITDGGRNEARRLEFAGAISGQRLTIARFIADHAQGRLQVSGNLRLRGDYPLSIQVRAVAPALYGDRPLRLEAELVDSLADLGVKAQLSGLADLRIDGRLQPLQPGVPYSATLRADRLGWPLTSDAQQVTGRDIRLRVQGDLDGYGVSGSGALAGPAIPGVDWRLQASGDWQRAEIQALELKSLDGSATISGQAGWAGQVQWQAELAAEGLDPSSRWPGAPTDVSGRASVSGAVVAEGWRLRVSTPGIDAVYRGQRLSARGEVSHRPDGQWRIAPLVVRNGANRVRASGSYHQALDLTAALDLPAPGRWLPNLDGRLQGRVTVKGPAAAPDVDARLEASDLAYQGVTVRTATVDGRIEALGKGESRMTVQAGGVTREGRQLDNVVLEIAGTRADHGLAVRAGGEGGAVELRLAGGLDEGMNWQGRLTEGSVAWEERRWSLDAPAAMAFDASAVQVSLAEHCWSRQQTSFCLSEPARLGASGRVAATLADMPLGWLSQWLPEGFRWSGRLRGDIAAEWSPQAAPILQVRLVSRDGMLAVSEAAPDGDGGDAGLPFGYERLTVDAELDADVLDARLALTSSAVGGADLRVRVRHADPDQPLTGRVDVEGIRLATLEPFFPRIEKLNGRVAAAGEIGGTLGSPTFNGELQLRDGEVQGPELPMHLEGIQVTVRVAGRSATLQGRFASGGNEATLAGEASWNGEGPRVSASLKGERLSVSYPPIAAVRVSPDLTLEADSQQVSVTGRIVVPEGQLTLKQLPKGAVPYSTDVVIVRGPGARSPDDEPNAGIAVSTDIEVIIGDELRFSGLGAEGRLTGALRLRQVGATAAEAAGEIRIVDARFEAYGQELEIRRGRLIFAGPVTEPLVEIEAVRRVETVVAGLRVEGPATQPEINLFSEPSMPEEQVLSYLVTGRAYGEAGPEEDAAMAQAAVALGVFTGRGTASDIASELGVEDFELAAEGEGEATQVTVSGYIAPNLLVKYGVGVFTPQDTLSLRYNVTRNVYLEAVSGLENSIDAFYSFSFE